MGIREDAEAAYAKTLELKRDKAREATEKLAADQAAAEEVAREKVEQWADGIGYPRQALISEVSFPKVSGTGGSIVVELEFDIDDLQFMGRLFNGSLTVTLQHSETKDIRNLEQLGKAIEEADREKKHRERWQ